MQYTRSKGEGVSYRAGVVEIKHRYGLSRLTLRQAQALPPYASLIVSSVCLVLFSAFDMGTLKSH